MTADMTPEQKLAELAKKARIRSERARKKAAEQGRGATNLILSARSRKVLEALAGRFGSKSAVVDHLCDRVLVAGDPGFEAERDGLAGSSVDTNRLARAGNSFDAQGAHTVQPDNPTKPLAAQGKTRDKGPAKTSAADTVSAEAMRRQGLIVGTLTDDSANRLIEPEETKAKRLSPGKPNPKRSKVKK